MIPTSNVQFHANKIPFPYFFQIFVFDSMIFVGLKTALVGCICPVCSAGRMLRIPGLHKFYGLIKEFRELITGNLEHFIQMADK